MSPISHMKQGYFHEVLQRSSIQIDEYNGIIETNCFYLFGALLKLTLCKCFYTPLTGCGKNVFFLLPKPCSHTKRYEVSGWLKRLKRLFL